MNNPKNPFGVVIPLHEPCFEGNEKKYLNDCIESTFVSTVGEFVNKFETSISQYVGSKYAIACVNGTSAIHISLILAGVTSDDEVIVPTLTFIAPINAVNYIGASPIFMDSDEQYNLNIEKTIHFLQNETYFSKGHSYNKSTNKIIKALIPVHVFGGAVFMDQLVDECEQRNIKIVEDATESLGTKYSTGRYKNKYSGTIGLLGCFSFNGNKIITTGGGGMIVTDDKHLAERAKYLTTQAKNDQLQYIHHEVGYNYRLTNVQAALGLAQLEKINSIIAKKQENYNLYQSFLKDIEEIELQDYPLHSNANYWLFSARINLERIKKTKLELIEFFNNYNIHLRPVWYLNHLQKPYLKCQHYLIETAHQMQRNTINIPSSYNLDESKIQYIADTFKQFITLE